MELAITGSGFSGSLSHTHANYQTSVSQLQKLFDYLERRKGSRTVSRVTLAFVDISPDAYALHFRPTSHKEAQFIINRAIPEILKDAHNGFVNRILFSFEGSDYLLDSVNSLQLYRVIDGLGQIKPIDFHVFKQSLKANGQAISRTHTPETQAEKRKERLDLTAGVQNVMYPRSLLWLCAMSIFLIVGGFCSSLIIMLFSVEQRPWVPLPLLAVSFGFWLLLYIGEQACRQTEGYVAPNKKVRMT